MEHKEFDFFISHASEDKEGFVKPLAEKLVSLGYTVWYDEFSIEIGSSIVSSISNGIKKSQYGLIILSKHFFSKKWTKREMESLINKEILTNQNLIIPIWLEVSQIDVYNYSPLLFDKLAITAKKGEWNSVVDAIQSKSDLKITTEVEILQIIESLKISNDDRRNKYYLDLEKRIKSIFLYQTEYYNWYTSDDFKSENGDWDEVSVNLKGENFRSEYGIPKGVWLSPEPFSWSEIEKTLLLCSKWIFRKLNFKSAQELIFLLQEHLDTDLFYILYNKPWSSIKNDAVYDICIRGVIEIGIEKPEKRIISDEDYKKNANSIIKKYYLP